MDDQRSEQTFDSMVFAARDTPGAAATQCAFIPKPETVFERIMLPVGVEGLPPRFPR